MAQDTLFEVDVQALEREIDADPEFGLFNAACDAAGVTALQPPQFEAIADRIAARRAKAPLPSPRRLAGPLTAKYRPRNLSEIFGQDRVVRYLRTFAENPTPIAFLFTGETGTGKTSMAHALAAELGCEIEHGEMGGLHEIPSGEQTADSVRAKIRSCWLAPMRSDKGWKVLLVNEADRMSPQAEVVWLDVLERLPPKTVIVFTTNFALKMSRRFLDRCERFRFESEPDKLRPAMEQYAAWLVAEETGGEMAAPPLDALPEVVDNGHVSFRRLAQAVGMYVRGELETSNGNAEKQAADHHARAGAGAAGAKADDADGIRRLGGDHLEDGAEVGGGRREPEGPVGHADAAGVGSPRPAGRQEGKLIDRVLAAIRSGTTTRKGLTQAFGQNIGSTVTNLLRKGAVKYAAPGEFAPVSV